ncbi:MAG: type II toxin-antitoxin system VapC family toxin [Cyanobacteriota bacterium]|nr:type II toxin-antitoxin system VapC family toxin [Cyanobacteriota bacterium]
MASGFLLDTHALQWWWCSPRLLSEPVRDVLRDPSQRVEVSVASWFELEAAHRAGQLPGLAVALERFPQLLEADGFGYLSVGANHLRRAGKAVQSHGQGSAGQVDPVDALLVAQAELESLTLISLDAGLAQLGASLYW